ncbi:branched-chain amino acid ABC transporter permease [Pseudonocardia lutea]|uniref:Branched-chain amino acid ABC transporter permease n=1 Tax=Pseudonocardia lutea TaxID=2172015 RepID=A0ABW1ICB2_9PSEU
MTATLNRPTAPRALQGRQYLTVGAFVVLVGVLGPLVGATRSAQFLVNLWLVYAVAGLGFYWIFGLAGRFAFCQTFMMALGGYVSAFVSRMLGPQAFLLSVAAGTLAAAVVATVLGLAVRKAQHFYFAIATFAVAQIGTAVFSQATGFTGTNGQAVGIPPITLGGLELVQDREVFWFFLAVLGLALLLAVWIERSPLRRAAVAARDNRLVADLAGVRSSRVQVTLFALGSALGGLAGALVGHWQGVIATDSFGIDLAIGLFLMLLLGGVSSPWGPVIGAAVFVALPHLLSGTEAYGPILYGVLLLVVVLVMPQGIVGGIRSLVRRSRREEVSDDAAG